MTINFSKYQATGNDFILIDNRTGLFDSFTPTLIKFLCDRHFGIGADGLMLLNLHTEYDFEMRFFNPDGSSGMMCGNGGRCIAKFASDLKIIEGKTLFLAADGEHHAEILPDNCVSLRMSDSEISKISDEKYFADTGAPHIVEFMRDLQIFDVNSGGRTVRFSEPYRVNGVNVNFVEKTENFCINVRTYERGVEAETLSCGTGVTASAIAYAESENLDDGEILVKTSGGNLSVRFKKQGTKYTDLYLAGAAVHVFSGNITVPNL